MALSILCFKFACANRSYIPRVHPPSQATIQEMLFQATTQGKSRA